VSVFVTDGSITFDFSGEKKEITAPRRFNIPPSTPHSAKVGPAGCILIIAEEIDGDS
jgi:quercetin dioxygenase-like cupin family protein